MWIGSAGCSNFASTIFSRPAFSDSGGLIGQHPRQAAALLGILDRGIGAVAGKARRASATRISRPSSTKRQSGSAVMAPNWMVSCDGDRLRRLRLAAPLEIILRGHHDPPHLADMTRDQRRIRQMADPDREIDAVFHQIDHAVRQPQFGRRPPDSAADRPTSTGLTWRRPNPSGAETTSRPLGRVRSPSAAPSASSTSAKDAPGALQIAGAGIGQRHRPRGPLQQPRAEALLQRRDQPRHRRRRQAELARRRRKALQIGDGDEGLHGVETIHGIISYIAIMKCQSGMIV